MQHELGVGVDEFDQSKEEALVASSVKFCCFLFEFKAGGHPFERQTLWGGEHSVDNLGYNTTYCFDIVNHQIIKDWLDKKKAE